MEVTMRASLSVEELWGEDFKTEHQQGQGRNDVFSGWGAILHCSGDICDGLWINGYPAAILDLHWLIYQSLREAEPESGSDTLCGTGDASSSQHEALSAKTLDIINRGSLRIIKDFFEDLLVISTTDKYSAEKKKGGKKPSGRISAEKAEKMTVSQEKMEDSRSRMTSKEYKLQNHQHLVKNSKTVQGYSVLLVHEVTVSPFGPDSPICLQTLEVFQRKQKPRTQILSKSPTSKKDQAPQPGLLSKAHWSQWNFSH